MTTQLRQAGCARRLAIDKPFPRQQVEFTELNSIFWKGRKGEIMAGLMIICPVLLVFTFLNGCTGVTSRIGGNEFIAANNLAGDNTPASSNSVPSTGTPIISKVRVTSTDTSCTVNWTTNIPSDSLAELATGMGPWIPAWSEIPANITDAASPGATNHSQTISNLWSGATYSIYLRSRPFSGIAISANQAQWASYDGGSNCNPLNDGSACSCSTPPALASGNNYDFKLGMAGTQNIVQGYDTYLRLYYADIARPSSYVSSSLDVTIGGLPPNSTIVMYDPNRFVASFSSSTGLLKLNPSTVVQDTALHIVTTASTPIGAYTITFSNAHAEQYPSVVHSYSYTVNVTGSSFPYGTPTSYPAVPNIGNKTTPGTWVYGMVAKGSTAFYCNQNSGAGANFYDAIRAYQQTKAYDTTNSITGNPSQWDACISNRETGYIGYADSTTPVGQIWAIYLASKGMMNLATSGDTAAQTALYNTANNAQWNTLRPFLLDVGLERELSFTTEAMIAASRAGDASVTNLIPIGVDYMLADVDQIVNSGVSHEMFLDGTLADTLIHYYIDSGSTDVRIPIAVKALADWNWNHYWISGTCSGTAIQHVSGCFAYSAGEVAMGIDPSTIPSPINDANLNLLIAPMYAWLFKMTGNGTIAGSDGSQCGGTPGQACTYQQAGDAIFRQGISQSDYFSSKDWAQNYRWSFDYVTWRTP